MNTLKFVSKKLKSHVACVFFDYERRSNLGIERGIFITNSA